MGQTLSRGRAPARQAGHDRPSTPHHVPCHRLSCSSDDSSAGERDLQDHQQRPSALEHEQQSTEQLHAIATSDASSSTSAPSAPSLQDLQNAPAYASPASDAATELTQEPCTRSSTTSPPPPPTPPPSRSLLDLPWPWLRLLIACLGPKELVVMLGTCKALHTLILPGRHVTVSKALSHPHATTQHHSLVLACQHAAQVHLKLSGMGPATAPEQQQQQSDQEGVAAALLHTTVAALGHTLDKVTQATLKGLSLDCLVPVWLTDTCPQLASLCLEDLPLPLSPPQPAGIFALKQLALPAPVMPAEDAPEEATAQLLTDYLQHLEELPSLQHLTITTPASRRFLKRVIARPLLQQRLTALHLPAQRRREPVQAMFSKPAFWTQLADLQIPCCSVDQQLLPLLLAMPALVSLSCLEFRWQGHDYSQHPCQWRHITVSQFACGALAQLPLDGLATMTISQEPPSAHKQLEGQFVIKPSRDRQHNDRVMGQLQRMGGLRWRQPPPPPSATPQPEEGEQSQGPRKPQSNATQIVFSLKDQDANPAMCPAGMLQQLLSGYQPVAAASPAAVLVSTRDLGPVFVEQLADITQLPARSGHVWAVGVVVDWVEQPPPAEMLSRLLPSIKAFNMLMVCGSMTEAQVIAMCEPQLKPAHVIFSLSEEHLQPDWEARIMEGTGAVETHALSTQQLRGILSYAQPDDDSESTHQQIPLPTPAPTQAHVGRPQWMRMDIDDESQANFILTYSS